MRWVASIIGVLLALMGIFFILQGTGIVPVGFMSNHIQYAYEGIVVVVVGAGLVWFANRPRSKPRA
jgi:amino acid transporter